MRPTSRQLAMRDPALAAAIGAMPGADYGSERGRAQFGMFGFSPYNPSRNIGFGVDASMVPPPPPPPPPGHPAAMQHAGHHMAPWMKNYHGYLSHHGVPPFWNGLYGYYGHGFPQGPHADLAPELWAAEHAATARRAHILDPNEHSRLKIERYSFSFSIGTFPLQGGAVPLEGTLQPNTRIRCQRIVMNSPAPNFVLIDAIQMANVNVLVGETEDSFTYNALAQGVMLDLPTLDPANRATVSGAYTNLLPANYTAEFVYNFIITFQGPSTIVGGL